ncbi:MAG: hypothetical protein LAQ30_12860, partial [Acidobacteriia bacterium]|nr:hypothetical protein [Terriglobia bacterium]
RLEETTDLDPTIPILSPESLRFQAPTSQACPVLDSSDFANSFTKLYLVSADNMGSILAGEAVKVNNPPYGVPRCPAFAPVGTQAPGTGPLSAPAPTIYAFTLSGFHFATQMDQQEASIYTDSVDAAAGVFTITTGLSRQLPGITQGVVNGKFTVNKIGTVLPINNPFNGTYVIDSDCAGGTISLGPGAPPGFAEFRFYFAADGKLLYLVSADNLGGVYSGQASVR